VGHRNRRACRGHTSKVISLAFRKDGNRLATTSADGTVRQWDPATGKEVEVPYDRHSGEVLSVAYSPDGRWIASGAWDNTVRLWDAQTGHARAELDNGYIVKTLDFSPDSSRLVTTRPGWLQVWDVATGKRLKAFKSPEPNIHAIAFHRRWDGGRAGQFGRGNHIQRRDRRCGRQPSSGRHPRHQGVGLQPRRPLAGRHERGPEERVPF
jgi:hypothetical protein